MVSEKGSNEELYTAFFVRFLSALLAYFFLIRFVACETLFAMLFHQDCTKLSHWTPCRGFQAHVECVHQEKRPSLVAQSELLVQSAKETYPVSTVLAWACMFTLFLEQIKKGDNLSSADTSQIQQQHVSVQPCCWYCFCTRRKLFL